MSKRRRIGRFGTLIKPEVTTKDPAMGVKIPLTILKTLRTKRTRKAR